MRGRIFLSFSLSRIERIDKLNETLLLPDHGSRKKKSSPSRPDCLSRDRVLTRSSRNRGRPMRGRILLFVQFVENREDRQTERDSSSFRTTVPGKKKSSPSRPDCLSRDRVLTRSSRNRGRPMRGRILLFVQFVENREDRQTERDSSSFRTTVPGKKKSSPSRPDCLPRPSLDAVLAEQREAHERQNFPFRSVCRE